MDITMSIVTGGGKKANRMSHTCTLKECTTWEEAVDYFGTQFKPFFPPQATLVNMGKMKERKGKEA